MCLIKHSNELISKEISEYYAKKKKDPNITLEELLMIGVMESWIELIKTKRQVEETKRVNEILDCIVFVGFVVLIIGLIYSSFR